MHGLDSTGLLAIRHNAVNTIMNAATICGKYYHCCSRVTLNFNPGGR